MERMMWNKAIWARRKELNVIEICQVLIEVGLFSIFFIVRVPSLLYGQAPPWLFPISVCIRILLQISKLVHIVLVFPCVLYRLVFTSIDNAVAFAGCYLAFMDDNHVCLYYLNQFACLNHAKMSKKLLKGGLPALVREGWCQAQFGDFPAQVHLVQIQLNSHVNCHVYTICLRSGAGRLCWKLSLPEPCNRWSIWSAEETFNGWFLKKLLLKI